MKGLVVRQLWAWVIMHTNKPELRNSRINYRGEIALVAGKVDDEESFEFARRVLRRYHPTLVVPDRDQLTRRAVIGIVTIRECVTIADLQDVRRLTADERAWVQGSPRRYAHPFSVRIPVDPPVPVRGMAGLFDLPRSLITPINRNRKDPK